MSCFISSGVELGCSDGIGGIKKIYVVGGGGEVTGYTYNVDGAVTGATSTTGTTLYGFQLKRNTSSLSQNTTKSFENGTIYWEQVLTAILFKYDQDKRNQLKVLGQNDQIQIVAIDQNDVVPHIWRQLNCSTPHPCRRVGQAGCSCYRIEGPF